MDSTINIIPGNTKGKPTDIEHSIKLNKREEALDAFKKAYKRMLNVNIWHKLSGFASADFLLRDQQGNETIRLAEIGDYFFRSIYRGRGQHPAVVTIGCR
ncbi:MAG: hypothetical protein ABI863_05470 [Ginsengibacter sp.]